MSSHSHLLEPYLAGPPALRAAVAGLTLEQQRARPVAGKLSTLEVVCHIADFEAVYADRMKRVIALANPTLLGADENRFLATLAYHDRNLEEELALIDDTRRQMARILRTLPEAAFARTGTHNERGPMTLEKLLTGVTSHLTHHLKFIHDKRRALGLRETS